MNNDLTLESAVDVYDEAPANLPTQTQPEDFRSDSPVPSEAKGDSLTLEEAAELDFVEGAPVEYRKQVDGPHAPAAMVNGKVLTLAELVQGYIQGQAVPDLRAQVAQVEQAANSVVRSAWDLADFMVDFLPPMPDPRLSQTDPGAYVALKAQHETGFQNISYILGHATAAKDTSDRLRASAHASALELENKRLIQHFPETADPEGRERFFDKIRSVAYDCDFSEHELRQVIDHRIFRLGYLATVGQEALARRQERPKKGKKQGTREREVTDPMRRLLATGSFEDALKVDFD